jgi:large subunit ribosomal protein L10
MPQTKQQKQEVLEALDKKIEKQKTIILFDFTGLNVKDFSNLRKKIKAAGDELKVVKKTLMSLAFRKAKMTLETKKISGEIALVFGYHDELAPAKTVYEFSKDNQNIKILGGFLENKNLADGKNLESRSARFKFLEAEEIITLAQLPSREELLGKFVGSLGRPMSGFLNVLQGNIKGLLQVLSQIKTSN